MSSRIMKFGYQGTWPLICVLAVCALIQVSFGTEIAKKSELISYGNVDQEAHPKEHVKLQQIVRYRRGQFFPEKVAAELAGLPKWKQRRRLRVFSRKKQRAIRRELRKISRRERRNARRIQRQIENIRRQKRKAMMKERRRKIDQTMKTDASKLAERLNKMSKWRRRQFMQSLLTRRKRREVRRELRKLQKKREKLQKALAQFGKRKRMLNRIIWKGVKRYDPKWKRMRLNETEKIMNKVKAANETSKLEILDTWKRKEANESGIISKERRKLRQKKLDFLTKLRGMSNEEKANAWENYNLNRTSEVQDWLKDQNETLSAWKIERFRYKEDIRKKRTLAKIRKLQVRWKILKYNDAKDFTALLQNTSSTTEKLELLKDLKEREIIEKRTLRRERKVLRGKEKAFLSSIQGMSSLEKANAWVQYNNNRMKEVNSWLISQNGTFRSWKIERFRYQEERRSNRTIAKIKKLREAANENAISSTSPSNATTDLVTKNTTASASIVELKTAIGNASELKNELSLILLELQPEEKQMARAIYQAKRKSLREGRKLSRMTGEKLKRYLDRKMSEERRKEHRKQKLEKAMKTGPATWQVEKIKYKMEQKEEREKLIEALAAKNKSEIVAALLSMQKNREEELNEEMKYWPKWKTLKYKEQQDKATNFSKLLETLTGANRTEALAKHRALKHLDALNQKKARQELRQWKLKRKQERAEFLKSLRNYTTKANRTAERIKFKKACLTDLEQWLNGTMQGLWPVWKIEKMKFEAELKLNNSLWKEKLKAMNETQRSKEIELKENETKAVMERKLKSWPLWRKMKYAADEKKKEDRKKRKMKAKMKRKMKAKKKRKPKQSKTTRRQFRKQLRRLRRIRNRRIRNLRRRRRNRRRRRRNRY